MVRCELNYLMIHNVEIWRYSLDVDVSELRQLRKLLCAEEAERAARFIAPEHGDRFIVARGRMRQILGRLSRCEAAALDFDVTANGKPFLRAVPGDCEPVRFNITHSGGVAALAVCRSGEVGIDIERVRTVCDGLAQRYFASEEVAAIEALPETERLHAFFRCWTRKEAFVKATGEGIKRGLDSFVVSLQAGGAARMVSIDGDAEAAKAYWLGDFDAGPGFVAAVCVHKGGRDDQVKVALHHFDEN